MPKKKISSQELRGGLGEALDVVRLTGDHYVIERRGKPIAALVPLDLLERGLNAMEEDENATSSEQADTP